MERRCVKEAKGQQGAHDSLLTENERLNREVSLLREAKKVWNGGGKVDQQVYRDNDSIVLRDNNNDNSVVLAVVLLSRPVESEDAPIPCHRDQQPLASLHYYSIITIQWSNSICSAV